MRYLLFTFLSISTIFSSAQLTVINGAIVSTLVDSLTGSGVTFSNVSFSGVYGTSSKYQAGIFTATGSVAANLGMSSGIVLCTGKTNDIPLAIGTYPGNSNFTSSGLTSCTTGEVREGGTCASSLNDIDVLAGSESYYNSAVLEFDFVPTGTSIEFQYVFGSEEYDQDDGAFSINYNCSSYNDKFGFIISGPGITGGQGYTNDGENIARLANGSEVAINSVNNGTVGSYGGSPSATNCFAANPVWSNGSSTAEFNGPIYGIQFNGNTKVLTASKTGLSIGQTYHIKLIVTDVKDGAYDSGVFLKAGSFSIPISLPVELIDFKAKCEESYARLDWVTSSEENNDHFEIQRSNDGRYFHTIGSVNGHGNSRQTQQYSFLDKEQILQTTYYRLKQVDYNGDYEYSNLIVLNRCNEKKLKFDFIKYNSSLNAIEFKLLNFYKEETKIYVFDMNGKIVYTTQLNLNEGENQVSLPINKDLDQAIYIIKLVSSDFNISEKLVVTTN